MKKITPSQHKLYSIEAIIFDLDGTIVDTEETCAQVVNSAFKLWGHSLSQEDTYSLVGRKFDVALHYLMKNYPIKTNFDQALDFILTEYRKKIAHNIEVIPGVVQAIHALAEKYPLALVSGSHRIEILTILEQLKIQSHFQMILGAEDYPQSKPEPDGYIKAMKFLAVEPQNVLVFEDSTAGLLSAKAARAWAALVTHTQCSTKELNLADFVIPNFHDIHPAWVEQLKLK